MSTQPHPITAAEWDEIGAVEGIREAWGVEGSESFAAFAADSIYGVRFDFFSGSPGYVGDLYILQGDALTGDASLVLKRDGSKKLVFAE
jgi:hypothetical protein